MEVSKERQAEILETAARLYRDEKIEWCAGSWAKPVTTADKSPQPKMSMCAEGALMKAVGMDVVDIAYLTQGCLNLVAEDKRDGFVSTSTTLLTWINEHADIGDRKMAVTRWNDTQALTEMESPLGLAPWVHQDRALAKQNVIDAFEACAKDLRNG